jgi:hypothetical protein
MGATLESIKMGVILTFFAELADLPRVNAVFSAPQDIIV